MSDVWDGRDPLRVFEVEQRPYLIFYVTIVKGHNITKGYWKDTLDTPDPFVKVTIKTAPNGTRLTKPVNNDANPDWNETFKFFLDPTVDNEMEITLVDANYLLHETISTKKIKISNMAMEKFQQKIQFSEKSAVDIEMWAEIDNTTELRYSLALCKGELHFIEKRRNCVFQAMKEILGDDAPRTINEVPTIGVLGSGGGFRALTAFSGVMGALVDSRISDMVMYNAGLSGSTWYLSSLYSHPDWPQKSPRELRNELRDSIESSPSNTPASLWRFWDRVKAKCDQGQPVSFTDLFGHLVGETLLQGRLEAKLTDQQEKLKEGNIPLPMYAGVHVKKEVSAKVFHEWIEFTPYEIGIMKYGTYMPAEMFGSKFFLGHVVKKYEESPLHFLQGIWGSAYCVRLKRYLGFGKKDDEKENSQEERDELDNELNEELPVQDSGSSDTSESEDDESTADANDEHEKRKKQTDENRLVSIFRPLVGSVLDCIPFWRSIDGRAAVVFNFLRGLSFQRYNKHEAKAQSHFDEIFEMYPTSKKKLYVVDAGLAFSSPYPLLLRPQRAVDLVLSFDYSSRDHDKTSLFSELLLAEEWARLNKVPFPVIDPTIADREGLKECYVFENPNDPKCPIVMHFVILNITFREFKAPGVPRSTEEEKDYANFDIFDDPNDTYSTFNFQYTNQAFDRLADLMEFNTLLCKELIVENIKKCVKKRAI